MVASAVLLMREHGVAGTSVAKVLEHSDGPRGSVGFHFPGGRTELLVAAVRQVGDGVSELLRNLGSPGSGVSAADIFTGMCRHYRAQLVDSDFTAGCPIWATAQEAYRDPELGPVVADVVEHWLTALAEALLRDGHSPDDADDLAALCISSLEGAITLARVRRSPTPVDAVCTRMRPLLHSTATD